MIEQEPNGIDNTLLVLLFAHADQVHGFEIVVNQVVDSVLHVFLLTKPCDTNRVTDIGICDQLIFNLVNPFPENFRMFF